MGRIAEHVADIMRRTRAADHYAVPRVERDETKPLSRSCSRGITSAMFWAETRRTHCKSTVSGNVSEGRRTAESVADYRELYISVACNCQKMSSHEAQTEINHLISDSGFYNSCIINSDNIAVSVKKLKPCKSNGIQ